MRDGDFDFRLVKASQQSIELAAQIRKLGVARLVCFATRKEILQRCLPILRRIHEHNEARIHHGIERHRANTLREHAQVGQCGACPVGCTVEVDGLISQHGADFIQVGHGDLGVVEPQVGIERLGAGFEFCQHLLFCERVIFRIEAAQRIRLPRPALIDQHNVAVFVNPEQE